MIPPKGLAVDANGLGALLGCLPDPLFRLEVSPPVPLSVTAPEFKQALLQGTTLSYCNEAFAALHEDPTTLQGRPLRDLAPGRYMTALRDVEQFQHQGRHEADDVRIVAEGSPNFFRAIWIADVEADELVGIWGVLIDETADRAVQQQALAVAFSTDTGLVGHDGGLAEVMEKVAQVAPTDATVLITGETGTGKELITQAIHRQSRRSDCPLIALNCGAISPTLVESELFGHEVGAFTGAVGRKLGRFELADGGTLFLDEVGDLPLDLQVKLLRVLQEGEFTRVGGTTIVNVDVRVVAATHRRLADAVQSGDFRQDLYYRLNVFPIRVPPLRERKEDIPALVGHLVERFAKPLGKRIESVPPEILHVLQEYPWPGNIRELANLVERSVIVTSGPVLQLGDWATGQYKPVPPSSTSVDGPHSLRDVERDHIRTTLERVGWRVSGRGGAAERLGLKPTTLEARMKKLGIVRPG